MNAKKCDICGRYYDSNTSEPQFILKSGKFIIESKLDDCTIKRINPKETYYDLCPVCMEELEKFLRGKENE